MSDKKLSGDGLQGKVDFALKSGLYQSQEEALAEIGLGDAAPEDFDRMVAEQAQAQQIEGLCYDGLLRMVGILWVPDLQYLPPIPLPENFREIKDKKLRNKIMSEREQEDPSNYRLLALVNGPRKKGSLIGRHGRTAEFQIRMQRRSGLWLKFLGPMAKSSPSNVLAHSLNVPVSRMKLAGNKLVRTCLLSDSWERFNTFPADVSKLKTKNAIWMAHTRYGMLPQEPEDIVRPTDQPTEEDMQQQEHTLHESAKDET